MLKYCPYCTKPLGFIPLIKQRLFAKESAALICDKCGSSISQSGSAKLGILIGGGGICGYFWGQLLGEFLPNSWLTLASSLLVACVIVVLLAYWTAPIKRG
ncbi:MAG: hypothetical protein B6D77_14320 [gamma proteobacterium symbiont of Ctena orbiculata]|nr:MAG: hypothetical protein B6D77_14320 [gamma proteobacterium symbiont of Ctena orbiculata]PVV18027.1 MAG: hypothetical protein B6D78_17330 [gamma proteobacterium symbiont of Ctena orbiculata]PVV27877.1 MAG: hypothetical protein B6D79_00100 [gamma proteobacterium symbiont of Ctena orbiculata]